MEEKPTGDSMVEYSDYIERMLENIPDKRTKEYKEWKDMVNSAIQEMNNKGAELYRLPKQYSLQ